MFRLLKKIGCSFSEQSSFRGLMCSCVEHVYKMYLRYGTFILTEPVSFKRVMRLSRKAKHTFKELIAQRGYSARVADELWKWYDFSEKKGVASF